MQFKLKIRQIVHLLNAITPTDISPNKYVSLIKAYFVEATDECGFTQNCVKDLGEKCLGESKEFDELFYEYFFNCKIEQKVGFGFSNYPGIIKGIIFHSLGWSYKVLYEKNGCEYAVHPHNVNLNPEPECPYYDGQLILVKFRSAVIWHLRYATGKMDNDRVLIYDSQRKDGRTNDFVREHRPVPANFKLP